MVVIDVETSGLDPHKYSILSIGAVDFDNPKRLFYEECKVWDGALISKDALRVNGFTEAETVDSKKQTLEKLMHSLKLWIDECAEITMIGQNPSFDRDFLNNSFRRAGIDFKFAVRTVDLHSVAFFDHLKKEITIPHKNKHSDLSLDNIAKYAGLEEEPKPHNALNGAKFEAEAFSRIVYGKQLLPEFKKHKVPKYLII
ncbi:MAG TPA: 3'-5' exonuclease [Ignavibacteria bacterium]|nr:3'-5' exonuclease [Ignavibacteria bacterium]